MRGKRSLALSWEFGWRTKLGEQFFDEVLFDWKEDGRVTLEFVRITSPGRYLSVVTALLSMIELPIAVSLPQVETPGDAVAAAGAAIKVALAQRADRNGVTCRVGRTGRFRELAPLSRSLYLGAGADF